MTALNPVQRIGRQIGECFSFMISTLDETEIRDKSIENAGKSGNSGSGAAVLGNIPIRFPGGMRSAG